ncbi:MAG: hypothetical protein JXA09_03725 [Anaerolineae bacterium]|nr:hypothetical protein [Anaerolineae bacterium]
MSIIDALTKGFQNVHRHWWILLIPILLDTFLWLGPRASREQLAAETLAELEAMVGELEIGQVLNEDQWAEAVASSEDMTVDDNAFAALRIGALGVPSLSAWSGTRLGSLSRYEVMWVAFLLLTDMPDLLVSLSAGPFYTPPVWQIPNAFVLFGLWLALIAAGIVIGSAYITAITGTLDQGGTFWSRTLTLSRRFAVFWALRAVVLFAMGLSLVLLLSTISVFSAGPDSLVTRGALGMVNLMVMIVIGLLAWISLYGIFFIPALALQEVSVWRAIWNSFNIVLRNFWPTVGLFTLINLIGGGLTILWQQLSTGSWLALVGIAGNAYVGTSLVTASLIYYQDRYARWQELLAELLQRSKRAT